MSIARMKKLSVIGHASVQSELLSELMALGVVEISVQEEDESVGGWKDLLSIDGNQNDVDEYDRSINRIVLAIDALERYGTVKGSLFRTRTPIALSEFEKRLEEEDRIKKSANEIGDLCSKLSLIQAAQNKQGTNRMALAPWQDYDLPLHIHDTKEVDVVLGTIPRDASPDLLKQQLLSATDYCMVDVVNGDAEQFYISIFILKSERNKIDEHLKAFGFTRVQFAEYAGTAHENIAEIDVKLDELNREREEVIESIRDKESGKKDLEYLHDYLIMKRDKAMIRSRLLVTDQAFYFDGWIPQKAEDKVKALLQERECYYEITDPKPDEKTPVLLLNGRFSGPFEAITKLYALPDSRSIDATSFFSLSFAIFFGMMLGDGCYGIAMAVVTGIILKKYRLEGMKYQMIKLFFYCGISTAFWGAMFGGWFGNFVAVVGETFFDKDISIPPIWFDPLNDPMKLLIFCFILGGIHLFLGMGLDAYLSIKDGRPLDAVFDVGLWYLLLIGATMLLVGVVPVLAKWMAIIGAVGILLTGGRDRKGIGKIVGGFSSLYGITGYLSDVLSYSRLLALGLASSVIACVVNTMGSLGGGGFKGIILMTFAFVVGHVYNMAINSLGSFVHSCRLQYVEFFGKFYSSGGEAFQPFSENTKYVHIQREEN